MEGSMKCVRKKFQKNIESCLENNEYIKTDIQKSGKIIYKPDKETGKCKEGAKLTKAGGKCELDIKEVYKILDMVDEKSALALGFAHGSHPRDFILQGILVIPPVARPAMFDGSKKTEDPLTHIYEQIVRTVTNTHANFDMSSKLYSLVYSLLYKNNEVKTRGKEQTPIFDRIQGKKALIRGLMMGKRNDYSARTVAGPAFDIPFGYVRFPRVWVSILTKPVIVNKRNRGYVSDLQKNGEISYIDSRITGISKACDLNTKISYGDVIHRYAKDGDYYVVNRQPTLHKGSITGYRVIFHDSSTIDCHLSDTSQKNLDFDGDEMNAWDVQGLEENAEAMLIMNILSNIMSAEKNIPAVGLVMNSAVGVFLLSNPDLMLKKEMYDRLISIVPGKDLVQFEKQLEEFGIPKYSGRACISILFPEDFYYDRGGVFIVNGVLLKGRLKKSTTGVASRSIIQELWKKGGFIPVRRFLLLLLGFLEIFWSKQDLQSERKISLTIKINKQMILLFEVN